VRRVPKPWGEEIIFAETDRYAGKVLRVRKGEILSLQYHRRKDETLYFFRGTARLWIEEKGTLAERVVRPPTAIRIRPMTRHRVEAIEDCEIFEVSTADLDDVVRLEDRYGRAGAADASPGGAEGEH
jgi:mannose-6-phosphate isomerase-like protein (cupin superfamily)